MREGDVAAQAGNGQCPGRLLSEVLGPEMTGADVEDNGQEVAEHPAEQLCVRNASAGRRREFSLGRLCARAALGQLTEASSPLLRTSSGAPAWPNGFVGSITHTKGYAAAIVGPAIHFRGLGIDAEEIGAVAPALWPTIFSSRERDYLQRLRGNEQIRAATAMFCAKEACMKAVQEFMELEFTEVQVSLGSTRFGARRTGWPGPTVYGSWAAHERRAIALAVRLSRDSLPPRDPNPRA